MTELPPVDALDLTPDGGLALRILRSHRQRCNRPWAADGVVLHELANPALAAELRARAIELDRAIELLEAQGKTT